MNENELKDLLKTAEIPLGEQSLPESDITEEHD